MPKDEVTPKNMVKDVEPKKRGPKPGKKRGPKKGSKRGPKKGSKRKGSKRGPKSGGKGLGALFAQLVEAEVQVAKNSALVKSIKAKIKKSL